MRSYYLLKDGVTITSSAPSTRVKSVARAATKKDAVKIFNARFTKVNGVYGDRKPGTTPRRLTARIPQPRVEAVGERVECICGGRCEAGTEQHLPHPRRPERVPVSDLGDDDITGLLDGPPGLDEFRSKPQQAFHYRSVVYTVPEGTRVTLTHRGEIILHPGDPMPPASKEDLTTLLLSGMHPDGTDQGIIP